MIGYKAYFTRGNTIDGKCKEPGGKSTSIIFQNGHRIKLTILSSYVSKML